jgi:hypothetical protein
MLSGNAFERTGGHRGPRLAAERRYGLIPRRLGIYRGAPNQVRLQPVAG